MSRLITLFLLPLLGPVFQTEPLAQYIVNPNQPLVGEPVEIELLVTLSSGSQVTAWPDFMISWADFDLVEVGELAIHDTGSQLEYRQTIMMRLWEPGEFLMPEIFVSYQSSGSAIPTEITPESLTIIVPSVLTGDETLRALKPQISLSYIPPALIVVLLAVVINVGIFVYDRRRAKQANVVEPEALNIRILDKQMMAILRQVDQHKLEPSVVYNVVSTSLRDYLCRSFKINGHELTTSELLGALRNRLSSTQLNLLGQLLSQADLVKFAKVQPGYDSARRYVEATARWLHTTETENEGYPGETA